MYESIKLLRPYFFSLREIENNVSLDIKLPLTWSYESIVKPYSGIKVKIQDKNDKFTLLSLISNATQTGYDLVLTCASDIIKINKEEEEKLRLFNEKVKELEHLFKSQSLDKLKEINLLTKNEQEHTTGINLVAESDTEGQGGDRETQESDDNGSKKLKKRGNVSPKTKEEKVYSENISE